ncbi:alpha/beta hydrolase-fold protein [Actinoplanes sp. NPDC089786]|uniref:alpha/beta hydrolase n=1 Tax=Actinoplanes sp. NPDC089786 TaxID=3155185 RepID=UPI0034432E44
MASIRVDFPSETLGLGTTMTVLMPAGAGRKRVLYLLHGLTDDHSAWSRFTSIERYAADHDVAVVMPQVHRSFYCDTRFGLPFWTFLSEELPRAVENLFRVSTDRADTFVAGLSMGGYGALKWALRQPERFAAAASLSGALDLARIQEHDDRPHMRRLMTELFPEHRVGGTDDDLLHLIERADPAGLPRLMIRCGTEDHTLPYNQTVVAALERRGIAVDSAYGPGAHEWGYWDREIQNVLVFLGLQR